MKRVESRETGRDDVVEKGGALLFVAVDGRLSNTVEDSLDTGRSVFIWSIRLLASFFLRLPCFVTLLLGQLRISSQCLTAAGGCVTFAVYHRSNEKIRRLMSHTVCALDLSTSVCIQQRYRLSTYYYVIM